MSVKQAAAALGVSVNTIRRWAREGRLRTERVARPQGYVVLVHVPEHPPEHVNGRARGDHVPGGHVAEQVEGVPGLARAEAMANYNRQLIEPIMAELTETRRRLESLAIENGRLTAQLEQLRETIRALEAPKAAGVDPDTTPGAEAIPEPAARPWWRFLWWT